MAGKIGKAIGFGSMSDMGMDSEPDPEDSNTDEEKPEKSSGPSRGEILAMKAFMNADSAEAKASALKDFMELCGGY